MLQNKPGKGFRDRETVFRTLTVLRGKEHRGSDPVREGRDEVSGPGESRAGHPQRKGWNCGIPATQICVPSESPTKLANLDDSNSSRFSFGQGKRLGVEESVVLKTERRDE